MHGGVARGQWPRGSASDASPWCCARTDSSVVADGGGGRLSGRLGPIVFAPSADVAVVATAEAVYAVDLRSGGRPDPLPAMDRTRELGRLEFSDTPALVIGDQASAAS